MTIRATAAEPNYCTDRLTDPTFWSWPVIHNPLPQ